MNIPDVITLVERLPDTPERRETLTRLASPWGPGQIEPGCAARITQAACGKSATAAWRVAPNTLALYRAAVEALHPLEVNPDDALPGLLLQFHMAVEAAGERAGFGRAPAEWAAETAQICRWDVRHQPRLAVVRERDRFWYVEAARIADELLAAAGDKRRCEVVP